MFALIHSNLHRQKIAIFVSKTTFHRWLNGGSPHLKHLAACDEILNTETTIAYVKNFNHVALQLSQTKDLAKISKIIETSNLSSDDKSLLGDHHKKRVWREHNQFSDKSNISFFEIIEGQDD